MRPLFPSFPGLLPSLLMGVLLGAASANAQPFSFGLKGGLPMTDFLNTAQSGNFSFASNTNRYIVGPTAELRLPFGLGVEIDILYRHFSYTGSGGTTGITTAFLNSSTTANAWEFPLLAKYRFPGKIIHPYVDGGVAWDTLSGLTQAVTSTVAGITSRSSSGNPPELANSTSRGFVLGAGISVKALVVRISPEIRYTRWGARHFLDANGLLSSNQNQAEFLLGITF
ncbi:MAG TPA: outer membrane beta-barrel protein [Candidatus Acidoferrales bacterium]|nr:outer membrane beta-barrel protein [Candidatus Acidoferrales bacterium]